MDHSETYHFSDVANSYSTSLSTKEELSKSAEIDHTNKHLRVKQRRQWGTSSAVETESDKENDNGSAISVLMDRNDNASEEGSVWSLDSYSAGQQQDEEHEIRTGHALALALFFSSGIRAVPAQALHQ